VKYTVIIPSRFQSTRLPGKPILDIAGKPMIQWVWERAIESGASQVIIATDNNQIKQIAESFAADVCMTSDKHQSGTDRLAEVVQKMSIDDDEIIVNVQGDEPLIPIDNISQVARLLATSDAPMSTLSAPIFELNELKNPNAVKVVSDHNKNALYFSRAQIPFDRDNEFDTAKSSQNFQRHIGIYAYRCGFLKQFSELPQSDLEKIEKLEQLRVLSHGFKIKVEQAETIPQAGIDTEVDLARVRKILASI
jgi:3-deoxy-manno-octulosonate cytidylyltransferase (CMP-KDO synthetase)